MNRQTATKTRTSIKLAVPALMALAALASVSCEHSDPVAIEGSTILLTATPNPVDLLADPTGTTIIEARVTTSTGVPQEDTRVFFSVTSGGGTVSPTEDTTDSNGVALTTYTNPTATTATVTAQSGSITANRQITVVSGTPTLHTLIATDSTIDISCTDPISMTGSLSGTGGPIAGTPVTFQITSSKVNGVTPATPFSGSFSPSSTVTGSGGGYTVSFRINEPQCNDDCVGSDTCEVTVRATAAGLNSTDVVITDNL